MMSGLGYDTRSDPVRQRLLQRNSRERSDIERTTERDSLYLQQRPDDGEYK
jgi:hypothetical protein